MFARDGWVVSLYDRTGAALLPWARAGYRCIAVDIAPSDAARVKHKNIHFLQGDVRGFALPGPVRFLMAWPPCTHFTSAGARWWKAKGEGPLREALALVQAAVRLADESGAPWMLENPVGRLSSHWRRPDVCGINPWMFAGWVAGAARAENSYTKNTCLWLGGGAQPPAPNPVPGLPINMGKIVRATSCAPSRSVTPAGLAIGIWVANDRPALAPLVTEEELDFARYPTFGRVPSAHTRRKLAAAKPRPNPRPGGT